MDNNIMNNNPENGERTFTQEEVNRIVSERLNKEKAKGDAALAEKEQQFAERERALANREALIDLKDQLKEMGLPKELLPVLNVQDKEALKTALEALKACVDEKTRDQQPYQIYNPNRLQTGDSNDGDSFKAKIKRAFEAPKE